jgi:hypothetical protein
MTLYSSIISLAILTNLSITTQISTGETKAYTDTRYNFTFQYPSSHHLITIGYGFFGLLNNNKLTLRASIEENAFKIFIKENNHITDIFHSFARERCKVVCGADGPEESTYCDEIESEIEYRSANGLRVLEFYLAMTRENYSEKTKKKSRVGPVYLVDLSQKDRHLALMIHPGDRDLASEKAKGLAQGVIESVRLLP